MFRTIKSGYMSSRIENEDLKSIDLMKDIAINAYKRT